MPKFLKAMPDHRPPELVASIRRRSRVIHPPVDPIARRRQGRAPGPLRIVWAARWEFDKAPEVLFAALESLLDDDVDFSVAVLGEQFEEMPEVFARARERLGERVEAWGFLPDREAYLAALGRADVFVSTAIHEFFGLSAVEAIAAGARPLLPRALAYPEVLELAAHPERDELFYDGGARELALALARLAQEVSAGREPGSAVSGGLRARMESFFWPVAAPRLDAALAAVVAD